MTYEMYRAIFLCAAIASGALFVVSIILFFTLHIDKVISDLSGRTARKAIENIQQQNEQSSDSTPPPSVLLPEREPDADPRSGQQTSPEITSSQSHVSPAYIRLSVSEAAIGETSVLAADQFCPQTFTIEHEITIVHTNEVIT